MIGTDERIEEHKRRLAKYAEHVEKQSVCKDDKSIEYTEDDIDNRKKIKYYSNKSNRYCLISITFIVLLIVVSLIKFSWVEALAFAVLSAVSMYESISADNQVDKHMICPYCHQNVHDSPFELYIDELPNGYRDYYCDEFCYSNNKKLGYHCDKNPWLDK